MPSLIKSTRLALLAAAVEWVTMRMVWPRSLISSKTSSKAADDLESRAPVGSSARSISGSVMMARATATRCFCPPEIS